MRGTRGFALTGLMPMLFLSRWHLHCRRIALRLVIYLSLGLAGRLDVARRESILDVDLFLLGFLYLIILLSCPSCLVWSGLILATCITLL